MGGKKYEEKGIAKDGAKLVNAVATANVPKFQGASNLSDIIDSYAKGVFLNEYDAIGHGPSSWRNKGFQELEIFANLFAVQNIPRAMKWVNKYMPETQKAFLERMKEIADDVR